METSQDETQNSEYSNLVYKCVPVLRKDGLRKFKSKATIIGGKPGRRNNEQIN